MTIELPKSATLRQAPELHVRLREALASSDELLVDAGALVDADLSLVQLLDAARTHAVSQGKSLRLAAPADGVLLGLLERNGFLTNPALAEREFWMHEGEAA